jgi:SAM-dependent methyltransferase
MRAPRWPASCIIAITFTLTFLNEKDRPSNLDVAERISCEVKRRGFRIAGLARTAEQRRGSVSEPVYLGSQYEGLVHHQWYTTRAATAGGGPVDDVPREALESSLREVIAAWRKEPREIAVVMGVRGRPGETDRVRNALACLRALNLQDMPRWNYRIVVVEQDEAPRLERLLAPLADRYIFLPNSGPYNRGQGFNAGAAQVAASSRALCLMDADLLVGPNFLRRGLSALDGGARAVLPFSEVIYLDAPSTVRAIAAGAGYSDSAYTGQVFMTSQGGCLCIESSLYNELGGHDERFRGWGREDREFWNRVSRIARIERLPGRMLHLDHPRPPMEDEWALANQRLLESIERNRTPEWRPAPPARDWQNWDRWETQRIEHIVDGHASPARSATARLVTQYGNAVLDAGCGPGAMWPYLQRARPGVSVTGLDVTAGMLAVSRRVFPRVPVCRADSGSLPFASGSFDVVLLRHVLEHLPDWLMESVLSEAIRVARRAVVVSFYVAPAGRGRTRETRRVGENFLETRWTPADLETPVERAGWRIGRRIPAPAADWDTCWVVEPPGTGKQILKFSIVMPTYRRPHTIRRAVASILAQTHRAWELIVIDNAGDANYRFDDPRIQIYRHTGRTSASYARNQGLRYATGDVVCFFDDDDEMYVDYLERFAALFANNPQLKMARCGMLISEGVVNRSYATPECCLRREFATASWTDRTTSHDQIYFKSIAAANGWSEAAGDIISIEDALCRAYTDPYGGLRAGRL